MVPSDQEWKHACYEQCLAPVLDAILKPTLDYDTVLDLDRRTRDFSIPASFRDRDVNSPSIVMQRASLSTALEAGTSHFLCIITVVNNLLGLVILQLHLQFFTRALSGPGVIQSEAQIRTLSRGCIP